MKECEFEPTEILKIDTGDRKSFISIRNLTAEGKAYKIKTTKPNNYIVKPSLGMIMPMEQVTIDVKLSEDCQPDDSHKFLIEVYDFDWKQPVSFFKTHLKTVKPTPLLKHKLSVNLSADEGFLKGKGNEKGCSSVLRRVITIFCFFFVFISFLCYFGLFTIQKLNKKCVTILKFNLPG